MLPDTPAKKHPIATPQYLEFHGADADGFRKTFRLTDSLENHAYPGSIDPPEHQYGEQRENENEIVEGDLGIERHQQRSPICIRGFGIFVKPGMPPKRPIQKLLSKILTSSAKRNVNRRK